MLHWFIQLFCTELEQALIVLLVQAGPYFLIGPTDSRQNYLYLVVLCGVKQYRGFIMSTTSVDLGKHFIGFISNLKETGRYRNASEAVRAGLRLLEEQETDYQTKLEVLRQAIIDGEESGESYRTHAEIIAEAKAEFNSQ